MSKRITKTFLSNINNHALLKRYIPILILYILCCLTQYKFAFGQNPITFNSLNPTENNEFVLKPEEIKSTDGKITFSIKFERTNGITNKTLKIISPPEDTKITYKQEVNSITGNPAPPSFKDYLYLDIAINRNESKNTSHYRFDYQVMEGAEAPASGNIIIKIPPGSNNQTAPDSGLTSKDLKAAQDAIVTTQSDNSNKLVSAIWTASYLVVVVIFILLLVFLILLLTILSKKTPRRRLSSVEEKGVIAFQQPASSFLDKIRGIFWSGNSAPETKQEDPPDELKQERALLKIKDEIIQEVYKQKEKLLADTLDKISSSNGLNPELQENLTQINTKLDNSGSMLSKAILNIETLKEEIELIENQYVDKLDVLHISTNKYLTTLSEKINKELEQKFNQVLQKIQPADNRQPTPDQQPSMTRQNNLSSNRNEEAQTFELRELEGKVIEDGQGKNNPDISGSAKLEQTKELSINQPVSFDENYTENAANNNELIYDPIALPTTEKEETPQFASPLVKKEDAPKTYSPIVEEELKRLETRKKAFEQFFTKLQARTPGMKDKWEPFQIQWIDKQERYKKWLITEERQESDVKSVSERGLNWAKTFIENITKLFGNEIINHLWSDFSYFLESVDLCGSIPRKNEPYKESHYQLEKDFTSEIPQNPVVVEALSPCIHHKNDVDKPPFIKGIVRVSVKS